MSLLSVFLSYPYFYDSPSSDKFIILYESDKIRATNNLIYRVSPEKLLLDDKVSAWILEFKVLVKTFYPTENAIKMKS